MSTLDEIEKRLAATTPGEWEAVEHTDAPEEFWCVHTPDGNGLEWSKADCQFIAHSKADLQSLLALARTVEMYEQAQQAMAGTTGGDTWEELRDRCKAVNDTRWRMFRALEALEKGRAQ